MNDRARELWRDLLHGIAVDPALADRTFEQFYAQYSGPGRFYHKRDEVARLELA